MRLQAIRLSTRVKAAVLGAAGVALLPAGAWALNGNPPPIITQGPVGHLQTTSVPAAAAFAQLAHAQSGRSFSLPGGCATLGQQRACVPTVSLDGRRLPDLVVLGKLVGIAGRPDASSSSLSSPEVINAAVAATVFERLLYLQGVQDGITATDGQVQAIAQQQLDAYLNDPQQAQHADVIPVGMTPRQYFFSPTSLSVYRDGLITAGERERITAQLPAGIDPTPTYRTWFASVLSRHDVTVNGTAPAVSLANALPERP